MIDRNVLSLTQNTKVYAYSLLFIFDKKYGALALRIARSLRSAEAAIRKHHFTILPFSRFTNSNFVNSGYMALHIPYYWGENRESNRVYAMPYNPNLRNWNSQNGKMKKKGKIGYLIAAYYSPCFRPNFQPV